MNIKCKSVFIGLLGLGLAVGSLQAEARDKAKGYLMDSSGNVVSDSAGDCFHANGWTPEDATIVGCDGVILDAPIEVIVGKGTGITAGVVIPAASMFEFDKAELTESGAAAIEDYRSTVRPELTEAYSVIIVGHADSTGNEKHNLDLSFRRAASVADYLVSTGLETDTLRVIGRGSKEPLVSNKTSEGRAQNRRVEIVVIGELRALDTFVFPSAGLFKSRSGDLSESGKALLEKNRMEARELMSRAAFIEIVGHTDDIGNDDYNMKLSKQRATAVRNYLVSKGLDSSKIVTTGRGESMPITNNSTPEGRAQNRRVEILVLGRLKD
jgi:outer membrane protein OmpA-like peptidoglycan-associated protein